MSAFTYEAIDAGGRRRRGQADAATAAALAHTLDQQGLFVLDIQEHSGDTASGGAFRFGRRREVLEVTRALGALLPAGLPLAQALSAAANVAGPELREVLQTVRSRVERGESLAPVLGAYPHLFSPLYVGLVRAGEKSGQLDEAFARLAIQLERDEALRSKVLSAMIYPILLASVGSIAVTVLLVFVLPRFAELLQGSGAALPASTAFMLNLSSGIKHYWYLLLVIPAAGVALWNWMRTTPDGMRMAARAMLAIPVVKTLRQHALAARFARVVSVLLAGGAPLLTALDDAIDSLNDPLAKDDTRRIRQQVRDGSSLRRAVSESVLFPGLLPQLIGVGEDAGRLKDFLEKAADIFEEKTERAAQRLATIAEPAMIVVFGSIIALVALSLLQAVYGINAGSFK
jgi:type II secretory pathway component PulF